MDWKIQCIIERWNPSPRYKTFPMEYTRVRCRNLLRFKEGCELEA